MMNKKKKAQARRPAPISTRYRDITRIENICLMFFAIFLILFIWGYYIKNNSMMFLGAGLGLAASTIQVHINLSNEEDEDIWE